MIITINVIFSINFSIVVNEKYFEYCIFFIRAKQMLCSTTIRIFGKKFRILETKRNLYFTKCFGTSNNKLIAISINHIPPSSHQLFITVSLQGEPL